jgi:hypothetical protein
MDVARIVDLIRALAQESFTRRETIGGLMSAAAGLIGWRPFAITPEQNPRGGCKKIKDRKRRKRCKRNARRPNRQHPGGPGNRGAVTLLAAGDIAACSSDGDEATAALLDDLPGTIVTLGDNVYEDGTTRQFNQCYQPSWGRHKHRTRPAPGNHDYNTDGAAGYFAYFGSAAGDPDRGYYSFDLGAWHIVSLNSNCSDVGGCHAGSPQEQWLRQDLAAHTGRCVLAYWHHPRFSFGNYDNNSAMKAVWQALYDAGAEIVLAGHDHNYQRYAPLDANGAADPQGIRQFVVGTGGKNHYSLGNPPANVEAHNDETFGILRLTLRQSSYEWQFIPIAGESFTDAGSGACH